jgi:superfamily II DNA or RNA helicase
MSISRTIKPGIRIERCLNKKHESEFVPQPHQEKIANYFVNSPHRGLLLYHLLGSGKSCTSILVAKKMLESGKVKHVYVLTPGSLRQNFINEFCNVCGDIKELHKYYTFITYNYNIFESIESVDFNDSLVIIDEAHNLINGAKNISKNPYSLYTRVLNSNARVLVLTGTVIFNNTYEWCLLGNLLKDDAFPNIIRNDTLKSEYFEMNKEKIFSKKSLEGIISFFPGNIGEYPDVIYHKPIKVLMSWEQDAEYNSIAEKENEIRKRGPPKQELKYSDPEKYAEEELLWIISQKYILSRSISNMVYPNDKYEKEVKEDVSVEEKNLIVYNIANNKETQENIHTTIDESGEIDNRKKKRDMLSKYGGWINSNILKDKGLLTYSPKFVAIITNILNNYNSKHVIFSFFVEHSGIRFIHNVLKLCKIKSIIYSGDVSAERRQAILNKFNKKDNRYGQKIKVLLMTEAGKEGITLKEVGHLHILETNTIANTTKQIIGRVARYKSHSDMPPDERKVHIWKYHSYSRGENLIQIFNVRKYFEKSNVVVNYCPISVFLEKIKIYLEENPNVKDNDIQRISQLLGINKDKFYSLIEDIYVPPSSKEMDFKNFKEYYDYFIKEGFNVKEYNKISEFINKKIRIKNERDKKNVIMLHPFEIQSIDEYLDTRSETKYEEFEDFYGLLQNNSIEMEGII